MIRKSFIFLDGIDYQREKNIWQQGINDWDDFLENKQIKGMSRGRKSFHNRKIFEAKKELYSENSKYFSNILPSSEHWRLYDFFKEDAVFLDIETTSYQGPITIVGLYDGYETKTFIKDIDLFKQRLEKELSKYKLLITFNGKSFDMPLIKRYFNIDLKIPHIDLRHCCRKIGLTGGLKRIEEQLEIKRPEHLKAYGGDDAIDLWRAFHASGDREYLDLLVQYNEEDIVNLKPIADFAVSKLKEQLIEN